jgi:sugar/nucleoside kinase (ribokinase family)
MSVEERPEWLAGDVAFVSEEDVAADSEAVQTWVSIVPVVVLTRGRGGCTVWTRDGRHDLAAVRHNEVDPTGAGDVFAAAFLIEYARSRDALAAARFATVAGALAVGGVGAASVGDRAQIEALMSAGALR